MPWRQKTFEILANAYKPFACGIVIHPVVDACAQLHNRGIGASSIRSVTLNVHPLVLQLTGKNEPETGLESKFSVYHAAAIALIEGRGGEQQYSDRAVRDAAVIDLSRRVRATVDPLLSPDSARVELALSDGRLIEKSVDHAIGSLARPMTDSELEAKFIDLAEPCLGARTTKELLDLCWRVETLENVATIAKAART